MHSMNGVCTVAVIPCDFLLQGSQLTAVLVFCFLVFCVVATFIKAKSGTSVVYTCPFLI